VHEGQVISANFDQAAPLRLIVRFHRGVHVDDAISRIMAAPATQLVNTISGVGASDAAAATTISGLSGVREVRRLKGVVRGVLVELPGSYHRGDTIAAFKAMPDVDDVEVEGVVTVQIADGELVF